MMGKVTHFPPIGNIIDIGNQTLCMFEILYLYLEPKVILQCTSGEPFINSLLAPFCIGGTCTCEHCAMCRLIETLYIPVLRLWGLLWCRLAMMPPPCCNQASAAKVLSSAVFFAARRTFRCIQLLLSAVETLLCCGFQLFGGERPRAEAGCLLLAGCWLGQRGRWQQPGRPEAERQRGRGGGCWGRDCERRRGGWSCLRGLRALREVREVFKGRGERGWVRGGSRMGCCCGSVGLARWEERIGFASKSSKLLLKTKQRCSLVSVCWGSSCFVIWISVEITQITTETDYSNALCRGLAVLGILVSGVCIAPVAYAYFGPAGTLLIITFSFSELRVALSNWKSFVFVCEICILRHEKEKGLRAVLLLCGLDIFPTLTVHSEYFENLNVWWIWCIWDICIWEIFGIFEVWSCAPSGGPPVRYLYILYEK